MLFDFQGYSRADKNSWTGASVLPGCQGTHTVQKLSSQFDTLFYLDVKVYLLFILSSVSGLKIVFHPQDEIFDMVKPKDPYKITLQDLVNSCQGDTVTSILIDLNGFWTYENREVLVANDNDSIGPADLVDT